MGVISVLHGLGNHITAVEEVGELGNYLFYTWMTVFFFNLAIPTGKIAVAAFLIEMNAQGSMFPFPIQKPNGMLFQDPSKSQSVPMPKLTLFASQRPQDPPQSDRRCRA